MSDFLLEIGTEEIPARMIDGAREELARRIGELAAARTALAESPAVRGLSRRRAASPSSPRESAASQPDVTEQLTRPFAARSPTRMASPPRPPTPSPARLESPVDALEKITTPKGEYLAATVQKKGRTALRHSRRSRSPRKSPASTGPRTCTGAASPPSASSAPCAGWSRCSTSEVVPLEFAGITAGRTSEGHRILSAGPGRRSHRPADYASDAARRFSDRSAAAEREHRIRKALDAATRTIPGARWREDKSLLDTVVNLTEVPFGDSRQLRSRVPRAARRSAGHRHARSPEVLRGRGRRRQAAAALPRRAQHRRRSRRPHPPRQRARAARPLQRRALLLEHRPEDLAARSRGHAEVGHLPEGPGQLLRQDHRASRTSAACISEAVRECRRRASVRASSYKAALLAKADLTTELVKEFTELQGIIGGLYATGRSALDPLCRRRPPTPSATPSTISTSPSRWTTRFRATLEGAVLAIADKADTIAGMFALGMQPTGSKDPFALRRAANGIVKIIAEHKLPLPTREAVLRRSRRVHGHRSRAALRPEDATSTQSIAAFIRERLEFYLRDARGFAYDVVNAVLAAGSDDVVDAIARAEAVTKVRGSEDFDSISAAFKRIKNILRQARESEEDRSRTKLDSDCADRGRGEALWRRDFRRSPPRFANCASRRTTPAALDRDQPPSPAARPFLRQGHGHGGRRSACAANRLALLQTLLTEFSNHRRFQRDRNRKQVFMKAYSLSAEAVS